ncbi:hypothetical protein PUR71_24685 [Streptomyces sp. SP17BM10]|uniref:hypothetical protein n=1 Tax=Streptomyces sp. SP17BM10 TaxID=3002530 RepID=UPI002E76A991|nr:hypothetical protein [Streptomyces sp. SP17BM10]MEE1786069.1 hypothetical protein [Streptomyces sp. SP17BM10]
MNSRTPPRALHTPRVEAVERLQVVIYLTKTGPTFPELEMRSCEEYALAFNWGVCLTVIDDDSHTPPDSRPKLQIALQRIRSARSGALLVPSNATISPLDGEFHEFSRQVEKAGGFIQVARR